MPGAVNEGTVCKHHDRCAYIEIKNYLGRSSGVLNRNKKKLAIRDAGEDQFAMGVEKEWATPNTVWQVMDAAFNYVSVEYMVRQYSYTGLAIR